MIPLLLLTLTLVAILAYLMGYHDGTTDTTIASNAETDETLNLLQDMREELNTLQVRYAELLSEKKYLSSLLEDGWVSYGDCL